MQHLATITLFTKTNENMWRCEFKHKDLKISAIITIDAAYPEIPPIFKLEEVLTKATVSNKDNEMEIDDKPLKAEK